MKHKLALMNNIKAYVVDNLLFVCMLITVIGLLLIVMLLTFGGYVIQFKSGFNFSHDPAVWGEFGDYVGGVLNPIISLFTIIFLILGVFYQRKEFENQKNDSESQKELDLINNRLTQNRNLFDGVIVNEVRMSNSISLKGPEAIQSIIENELYSQVWYELNMKFLNNYEGFYERLSSTVQVVLVKDIYKIQDPKEKAKYLSGKYYGDYFQLNNPFNLAETSDGWIKKMMMENLITSMSFEENVGILKMAMASFFRNRGYIYGHFIRNHFYLLNSIDQSKYQKKEVMYRYSRSFLSSSELTLLFYNLFSESCSLVYSKLLFDNEIFDGLESVPFLHNKFYKDKYSLIKQSLTNA